MTDHTFKDRVEFGAHFTDFECIEEARACLIKHGYDFDYCPFCGEELE